MKNDNVKNDNRFELREPLRSFISSMKNILNADACALYLMSDKEMDQSEKQKVFEKRFPKGTPNGVNKEDINKYEILKFIGVDDSYVDKNMNPKKHWNFDYKKRPSKYIIFTEDAHEDEIQGEGKTGKTARLKKVIYINDYISEYKSRSPQEDNDTNNGIHPVCKRILSIPIKNGFRVIGVLRFDIYEVENSEIKEFNNILLPESIKPGDLEEGSTFYLLINELCQQVIQISNMNSYEQSYRKLFNGEKIIESIKFVEPYIVDSKIEYGDPPSPEYNKNYKIYQLVEHLFFVFQRRTYIGYDEIMKRVMYFIKDIFDILEISDYYEVIKSKLDDFRDHEQLMLYDTEKYRDHFMHQFHVFILGYVIINYIGIKVIKESINKRLKNTADFKNIVIGADSVLRIWVFISFFHDITYIFEEYKDKIQTFIFDQLNSNIPVNINWGNMISEEREGLTYMDCLENLLMFFESTNNVNKTNKENLFRNYIQSLHNNQDHGVLSALLLIQIFIPFINNKINNGDDINLSNKKTAEIYLAALAISFHNKCVFSSLKENNDSDKLSFESFPLEFLLIYCDTAQEWGRKKEIDKKSYSAPILRSVLLAKEEKKKITCNLEYLTCQHPDDGKLKSYLNYKLSKFCSKESIFQITYNYSAGKNPVTFTFPET